MDEVNDPAMTILAEGFFYGGPKSYLLNKIEGTSYLALLLIGQRKNVISTHSKNYINKLNVMFHTRVKAASRIGPHHEDVISVIVGSLLGDCYANRRSVEGTRLCYRQSIVHKDYLYWLYSFFYSRGYCSNLEPRMYTRRLKGEQTQEHYGYEFNSFTFRSFNWIHELFYSKGKKVIHSDIEKYITPLALAVWIMDDGGWAKPGVRVASNSFKLEQVQFLVEVLKYKFDLDCTIQKIGTIGQHSIYIKGSSIPTLKKLILPFLHPSMHYKLGL